MQDLSVATAWIHSLLLGYMPEWAAVTLECLLIGVGLMLLYAVLALFYILFERKVCAYFQCRLGPNRVGPWGLLQSVADMFKILIKELISLNHIDKFLFALAPYLVIIASMLAFAVLPWGNGLQIINFNVGIFFLLAVSSIGVLGILLAGWSSNNKFTLIGATTRAGMIANPLRDRFGIICRLEMYTPAELKEIVARSAKTLGIAVDGDAASEIARRSRGTPRIANRLLKRVRDFSTINGNSAVTVSDANYALGKMEIDGLGLDEIDRSLLRAMIEKFDGKPVGLETLAATINEDAGTIEDVYEPYLLQLGFIARTPRGRMPLRGGYEHLGFKLTEKQKDQLSLFDKN